MVATGEGGKKGCALLRGAGGGVECGRGRDGEEVLYGHRPRGLVMVHLPNITHVQTTTITRSHTGIVSVAYETSLKPAETVYKDTG